MKREYTLQADGVKMIDYADEMQYAVKDTARYWRAFCKLPSEYKQLFATSNTQMGTGYETKDGSGPRGDNKENFDYSASGDSFTPIIEKHFNQHSQRFIDALRRLHAGIQPMIKDFGRATGIETDQSDAFIRCLYYPSGRAIGDVIASPHTDHSGFTFHLYETTEGCERLTFNNTWKSLPVAEGQAAAFGGMQSQLVTKGKVKALCHRVVANETSARYGRTAIVCFVALPKTPIYNKKAYGRLQEMSPGFNYEMDDEKFSRLFIR